MVKRICKYGEDILRKKTKPVSYGEIKPRLPEILDDMWETLLAVRGLGLAAPQIGLDLRLAVLAVPDEDKTVKRLVLLNPEIVEKSGHLYVEEGCLSFPGLFIKVPRSASVKALALNEYGAEIEIAARGSLARAVQHEVDHLDGKLLIDRVSGLDKIKAKAEIKGLKKEWKLLDESKLSPGGK